MLNQVNLYKILFLDIETVPQYKNFDEMPMRLKSLWELKANQIRKEDQPIDEMNYERAGIYAEFGKIICISLGFMVHENGKDILRLKSFYGHDEKVILQNFKMLLEKYFNTDEHLLCGHNANKLEFPYLLRRMLINGMKSPDKLNLAGKKPWEVDHLDTMQLCKFGDFKSFTSLDLLAAIFDIPSPKDDISGADVGRVYWEENGLERIVKYCEKDVVALTQIFRKYVGLDLLPENQIVMAG